MRYWVYINDKVDGPFDQDTLVTLNGFTPDTLICSEDTANSGNQEWVKASAVFEFDESAPQTQAPAAATPASTQEQTPVDASSVLLAKLDIMANQLMGLQSKMDGMQTKLDESIAQQKQAAQQAAQRAEELAAQVNNLSAAHQAQAVPAAITPVNEPAPTPEQLETLPAEENLADLPEDNNLNDAFAATPTVKEQPQLPTQDPVVLPSSEEDALDKGGDDLVLSSALDSLNVKDNHEELAKDEKENSFQDLLTPAQAASLAEGAPAATEQQKEALIAEFSAPTGDNNNVLDQVIKEREEEESSKSKTMRWITAGAAAIAGAVGLKNKKADDNSSAQEQPQPTEEKQTLDFDNLEESAPALTIAPDPAAPQKQEEVFPAQEMPADVASLEEAPAAQDAPIPTTPEPAEPTPVQQDNVMPSLDNMGGKHAASVENEVDEQKEDTLQELVPDANNASDSIITEDDLKDAFSERKSQDAPVEQLFGLASAGAAVAAASNKEEAPATVEDSGMPSLEDITAKQPADAQTLPEANPNDLTEIELKEGSTYLISDFVPPASSREAEQAALEQTQKKLQAKAENTSTDSLDIQEMVANVNSTEKKEEPKAEVAGADVTVSQIVLENTIKAKRGAALDIKTVPMVPEPSQSNRLQIDGMDDINTQHDIKAADVEPAGKTTKMVVGSLIALLLASVIYGMLGFMNLIPEQFNVFSKKQAAQEATQQEQLNEMLDDSAPVVPTQADELTAEDTPAQTQQDVVLTEVKNYVLPNGMTLQSFIEAKHPAAVTLITWDISTAVDPDNYSVLVKVPPENPQSFKTSYRFNYNAVTKALEPTISDAKNLLDAANQPL